MNQSKIEKRQPEPLPNNEQDADNISVSPSIANALVGSSVFKYIEIKKYENGEVVKRMDVSHQSDHNMDKLERGMNINLNHDQYYTFSYDSEVKLETV